MRVGDRLDVRGPSAVRFRGTDRTEFLDNRQFHGNAFALLTAAERFLRDSLPIAGRIEEGRVERIDEPLVPPLATREVLANPLCHRNDSNAQQRDILDLSRHSEQPLALREIRARLPASASVRQVKRPLARLRGLELAAATGHGVSARWKPGLEQ